MKKVIILLLLGFGLAALLLPSSAAASCGGADESSCATRPPCHVPGYRPKWEFLHPEGICRQRWYSDEPDCDCDTVVEMQPPRGPVYGVADTHAHQFSNLAFGGALLWGRPFDERGINEALAWGDWTWDFPTATALDWGRLEVPYWGHEVHADLGAGILSWATEETAALTTHHPSGAGPFLGWPKFNTTTHQQMYYRWLERAYKGGMRLMVMLAVNNEVVCELPITRKRVLGRGFLGAPIYSCEDMDAVDLQLAAYRDLEDFIDRENDGVVNGNGWYRIVETPYEARKAIRAGKMAVVLGIEVDGLFRCENVLDCTYDKINDGIDYYWDQGVRHMFPVHLYDNAFGGSAIYNELWPSVSPLANGTLMLAFGCEFVKDYFVPGPLSEDDAVYEFQLEGTDFIKDVLWLLGIDVPFFAPESDGHCNPEGLSVFGEYVIDEMMDQKLVIDTDHLSIPAFAGVLQKAELRDYPMISGHTFLHQRPLTEKGRKSPASEGHRTKMQIEAIRDLGGIVAPLNPRFAGSSTRDYAHMYKYIVELMGQNPVYGQDYPGIAYASDWGAMYQQTAPRCENPGDCCPEGTPHVCSGPENTICGKFDDKTFNDNTYPINVCEGKDYPMLEYPFEAVGVGGTFYKQKTGKLGEERIFDFNKDGLAHVGLLPDFFKDLTNVGLTEGDLEPLFHSAEVYIRMWEKINGGPPVITPLISGTLGNNGWYISDVTVSWQIESESTIHETDGCDPVTIDYDTAGVTLTCFVASDGGEAQKSVTIKRDATPPELTCQADPVELWPPNSKMMPVTVHTTFTDNLSGTDTLLISEAGSNEPDSLGKGDKPNDIQGFRVGSDSASGELRAQREGSSPGRIYTLGYTGYDLAGNATDCTTHVTVPHDKGVDE